MTTFAMPESAVYELETASNWPKDCPTGWAAIMAAPRVRAGRGWTRRVTMTTADATDLADYLWDAAGAAHQASLDDGGPAGGWQRRVLRRIEKEMGT